MNNPLGYCQLSKMVGDRMIGSCQQPLCTRNGRIECEEGHPQPDHPEQKKIDALVAARKNQPPPEPEPVAAPYVPEPTWVALQKRIAALESKVSMLEGQVSLAQQQKRRAG